MFHSPLPDPHRATWLLHLFAPAFSVALLMMLCAAAHAQIGGIDPDPGDPGTGGKNTIQGTIFLPGGRRMDRRVKVSLNGLAGATQFQMSDDMGAFSFRRLKGGRYTLVVDAGDDFEVATEAVDIIEPPRRRNDPGITQSVYITLQPHGSRRAGAVGTVYAAAAAVPDAALDLYKKAVESAKAGDRKKAIEELNRVLEACPTFVWALNELGVQYLALKQYGKAKDALRAALKLAPDSFYPRLNYGIALLQEKDYRSAAVELQQAIQKDSSSPVAYLHFGRALVSLGNYAAAEAPLQICIDLGGESSVEAHRYLAAVYIETRQASRAADQLETYLKLVPKAKDADKIRGIIQDLRARASAKR